MPIPVPNSDIGDEPKYCLIVNSEWVGIITGLLRRGLDPDYWLGDEEEKTHAIQQIETLMDGFTEFC